MSNASWNKQHIPRELCKKKNCLQFSFWKNRLGSRVCMLCVLSLHLHNVLFLFVEDLNWAPLGLNHLSIKLLTLTVVFFICLQHKHILLHRSSSSVCAWQYGPCVSFRWLIPSKSRAGSQRLSVRISGVFIPDRGTESSLHLNGFAVTPETSAANVEVTTAWTVGVTQSAAVWKRRQSFTK